VTWQQVAEKVVGYLFILAILYICSQTILQWDARREINIVKDELRKEFELDKRDLENTKEEIRKQFEADKRDLQKQIIRLELQLNDSIVTHKYRMDALEESIIIEEHK